MDWRRKASAASGSPARTLQRRYGIHDGAQQGLEDWHAFAEFGPEDHWPRAWAEAYVQRSVPEIYDWLRGLGVEFMPMPLWVERGLHTPGNSVPRWHIVWGTGYELAVVLNQHLLSRPNVDRLQQRYDHCVEALVATNGRVTGCRGTLEGSGHEFEASAELGDRRVGRNQRQPRAREGELARGLGPTARDDAERVAQVRRRTPARCGRRSSAPT